MGFRVWGSEWGLGAFRVSGVGLEWGLAGFHIGCPLPQGRALVP